MLKCILIKRKLYDYLDDSLSETAKLKVKNHLDACHNCREQLSQIKTILDLAGQKNIPQPKGEFWHNFKIDLDRKLNDRLVGPLSLKPLPRFSLKPALAYAVLSVFFLAIAASLYKFPHPAALRLAQNDDELIEEAIALDELGEALELDHDEDAYLEEVDLFLALEQA
ncbi:MAG: hypothetical protein A3J51_02415 [Omnitrophica WOR_2 bacterium RIFCSPHIGHO2_02_FULL_45_21]|nr:MAG: hypothetical protein A3J51_02415 [Omnitrophica WOR_2 bacterium RIFCSPHIGHO2_02_FULL_45_21]